MVAQQVLYHKSTHWGEYNQTDWEGTIDSNVPWSRSILKSASPQRSYLGEVKAYPEWEYHQQEVVKNEIVHDRETWKHCKIV